MAITIILICLAIQRWFCVDRVVRNNEWFDYYYRWISDRFSQLSWWPTWLGVVTIILPALIIYMLAAGLIYHVLTIIGYYLLALVVLWYALDAKPITAENTNQHTLEQLLIDSYQRIFALIFWLVILGSTGVVLYTLIVYLRRCLEGMPDDSQADSLLANTLKIQAILDWIPLRLLGLTFALVGQFSVTFSYWYQNLLVGLEQGREQTAACGLMAISLESSQGTPNQEQVTAIEGLINRSLWIWLVVIAVFTIGHWVG